MKDLAIFQQFSTDLLGTTSQKITDTGNVHVTLCQRRSYYPILELFLHAFQAHFGQGKCGFH